MVDRHGIQDATSDNISFNDHLPHPERTFFVCQLFFVNKKKLGIVQLFESKMDSNIIISNWKVVHCQASHIIIAIMTLLVVNTKLMREAD